MSGQIFEGMLRAIERGAFPRTRKFAWRSLYRILPRFWPDGDWRFMNYGYLPPGEPFPLAADDEPDRAFIGLYQQAIDGLPTAGARVLEVGSGRGGGARYIARYGAPATMIGLDYSPEAVRLARRQGADTPSLSFEAGDAEALPFPDGSFDIVVNIESSHCYADVPRFAREVARVLKPGGWFTFADMRAPGMLDQLGRDLGVPGLTLAAATDLTPGVLAALDAMEQRKRERIARVRFMRRFLGEFAGVQGSLLYQGLSHGYVVYPARRYRKTADQPVSPD